MTLFQRTGLRRPRKPAGSGIVLPGRALDLNLWPVTLERALIVADVTVLGNPPAKERPRVNKRSGTIYTPRSTQRGEWLLAWEIRAKYPRLLPDDLSRFGVRLLFDVAGNRTDLDNLAKLVLDAANGVLWLDDSQVAELHVRLNRRAALPATRLLAYRLPEAG